MKGFLLSLAGSAVAILLLLAIAVGVGACVTSRDVDVRKHSWLLVELYDDLPEYDPPAGPLGAVTGGGGETLQNVLDSLAKAGSDKRITGVIFKISSSAGLGMAQIEEIRGAIDRLQATGKKVYAWAESFEEREYYLLTTMDAIYAPPTSYIGFKGFRSRSMHIKNALDKLGIVADLHKIKDYKAAAEMMTRTDASEPARENDEWLLDEGWTAFTAALAADRGLAEGDVERLMQHALFTAAEAKDANLIDHIKYWDQLEAELKREGDDTLRTVSSREYAGVTMDDVGLGGKQTIAVIHAQGLIAGRESGVNPLFGVTMGHATIVEELRRARLDEDVEAVILRVDSPGGDALGSDLMGHEVERTTSVKPVVVSMVDVAASGGYHISYRASRILADPMTITGSIGSISGKFDMAGFYDKLGVDFDEVTRGPNALFDSDLRAYTPDERARFEEDHWAGFNAWLSDVAEHRGMTFDHAETLAHGRVWSGRQAWENGLVDELGDLHRAVEVAKELAGIDAGTRVTLLHYPEPKGLIETLMGGGDDAIGNAARWFLHRELRHEVRQAREILESRPIWLTGVRR